MKKNNNKGFTFIELVLYIGILSVFMVAVTSLVGTVVSSNRKMTNRKKIQNEAGEDIGKRICGYYISGRHILQPGFRSIYCSG